MRKITILALIFCPLLLLGQNVMSLSSATAFRCDTVTVEVRISNAQQFVAFQADIQFPPELMPLPGTCTLSNRSNGHTFNYTVLTGNVVRLLAFSLNQSPFLGDSGAVANFKVALGNPAGTYQMTLASPVISNANSQNILTAFANGFITIADSILKVELTSFNVTPDNNNQVSLTWETSTEENALRFIVDRITESTESCRTYSIDASGTTTTPRRYSLTDDVSGISGKILYRLWEVEVTGTKTLLAEREIQLSSDESVTRLFQNYPNPFRYDTIIRFYAGKEAVSFVHILNTLGQNIRTLKVPELSGRVKTVIWDGKDNRGGKVTPGVYIVTVIGKNPTKPIKAILSE